MKIIESWRIGKKYGEVQALDDLTFSVNESEIFGFIGPDGAGKTTLFRIIATLLLPEKGKMRVLGVDVVKGFKELRRKTGYMPGRFSLYNDLTVQENLEFYATVFGTTVKENYDLIADIYSHIEPFRKRLAGKLSGGMKQKLALSCALIHKPSLLILDEPTTGIDAVSRSEFWELLGKLKEHRITVVVSTPYMDEAMKCNRVALIQSGKILSVDEPDRIRQGFSKKLFTIRSANKYSLIKALRNYPETNTAYPFGETVHITFSGDLYHDSLFRYLEGMGINDAVINEAEAGIEDRFLELMEKGATEQRRNGLTV